MSDARDGARLRALGEGRFAVDGELRFATVMRLDREARREFAGLAQVDVDLAGVTRCDSAALALLLEWAGRARRDGVRLGYRNLPTTLLGIAAISEVDGLLPRAQ